MIPGRGCPLASGSLLVWPLVFILGSIALSESEARRQQERAPRESGSTRTYDDPSGYANCPKEPRSDETELVFMLFHVHVDGQNTSQDFQINQLAAPSGDWNTSAIDRVVSHHGFDLQRPTLMYTGGWFEDSHDLWLRDVRKHYNQLYWKQPRAAYNLLFFDWSAFAYSDYGRSVAAVPELGQKLARFFEHLRDQHKYNLTQLHLVSFSLSTHIVGLAARRLAEGGSGSVGQITYLDPTGVCFHNGNSFGDTHGARADDAALTVARHYNMFGLGARRPVGSLDIIVNDGRKQPSMETRSAIEGAKGWVGGILDLSRQAIRDFPSHRRAVVHESEPFQLDADCHEMAYECADYERFQAGECGSCGKHNQSCYLISTTGNIQLGREPAKLAYRPGTRMFLNTGRKQLCAYQYQVILDLKASPLRALARLSLALGLFSFKPSEGVEVRPTHGRGNSFTQLLTLEEPVRNFKRRVELVGEPALLTAIKSIHIKYLSHALAERRAKYSFKYCPNGRATQLVECELD